jgi:Zn-dependent metalloprotease
MTRFCGCVNCIMPPHLLKKLLESPDKDIRDAAMHTLMVDAKLRGERVVRAAFAAGVASPANGRRTIFDCRTSTDLATAVTVRSEDGPESSDGTVNRAFDGFGKTREFYSDIFDRNSIDDRGLRLEGYVHRGIRYNNAFWDGSEMVFGDGDGRTFADFTKSVDVIAHELTHGVTQYTAGLAYHDQSGALNESISDVFGSLVKQWSLNQSAEEADWLIGAEVFAPGVQGEALRSMKAPGTAYDDPTLGKDPQPDNMTNYQHLPNTEEGDNGGVHINSGIPNKAFYETAIRIGGYAWEAPGHIWYESLKASSADTEFQDFADTTYFKAGALFGMGSTEQQAVQAAWREVGIRITGAVASRGRVAVAAKTAAGDADRVSSLTKQVELLSAQVKALAKDVGTLKVRR